MSFISSVSNKTVSDLSFKEEEHPLHTESFQPIKDIVIEYLCPTFSNSAGTPSLEDCYVLMKARAWNKGKPLKGSTPQDEEAEKKLGMYKEERDFVLCWVEKYRNFIYNNLWAPYANNLSPDPFVVGFKFHDFEQNGKYHYRPEDGFTTLLRKIIETSSNCLATGCSTLAPEKVRVKVQLLIIDGIDVNARNEKIYNTTPLHMAVFDQNVELIRGLLSFPNIDVTAKDSNGHTPLDFAKGPATKYFWEPETKYFCRNFVEPYVRTTMISLLEEAEKRKKKKEAAKNKSGGCIIM